MDLAKKLAKIFSLIFLATFVASCDSGCVEAYEFDKEVVAVESNPIKDGVQGFGSSQVATWHDTGLKTNGEAIALEITGAWVPWYGDDDVSGQSQLNATPVCKFCAMSSNSPNCICYSNQTPTSEIGYDGGDCASNLAAQNDAAKCTCTRQYGLATDYGIYHFPLNKYDKAHAELIPDEQEYCKYTAGMGLYVGLFGNSGAVVPLRAYHLFSQVAACDVVRDPSTGKCLDDFGNDITKYIFTSANDKVFVKDDANDNNGIDPNPGDDVPHSRNEVVKLIVLDSRYDDNYGSYKVSFLGGVGNDQDKGLLEYLVRLIEDKIMGTPDSNGVRQGGVIQTMFSNIVQDSGFVAVLQMALSFYILFYGVSVLIGLADVSKKELTNRAVKIALVIFFTSATSWYWYDKIVVTFFKDGMDSVIAMIMTFSDQNIDPTSGIITAQMDRASLDGGGNATRFSYADLIIRNLLSVAAAKKIFGLFFGAPVFGLLYIIIIYGLIAFFIYVMLSVAMFYALAIIKLAFVLSLGPIFIAFTLSGHTNDMFKKWVSFISARSLEIIFMFLILYNFLVLIDQNFTSLLGYKACVTQWNLGLFSIPILKAQINRSLVEWFSDFITLMGLIFITKIVLDKVPDIAGSLISIGGTPGKAGSFGTASAMTGGMIDMAKSAGFAAGGVLGNVGAKAYQGISPMVGSAASYAANNVGSAARMIPGVGTAIDTASKVSSMLPSNPRAMYRNSIIDAAIARAEKEVDKKEVGKGGLTGKAREEAIRGAVVNSMLALGTEKSRSDTLANSFAKLTAAGINLDSIRNRLDEKLIHRPLVDFIKSESAKLKAEPNPPIGKDLQAKLEGKVNEWADKNIAGGAAAVKEFLNNPNRIVDGVSFSGIGFNNMKQFMRNHTEYTAAEAAKAFANNPEKQQEYLQHLKDNQFRQEDARQRTNDVVNSVLGKDNSLVKGMNFVRDNFSKVARAVKPFDNAFGNDALTDSKRAAESFMRKVSNEENKTGNSYDFISRRTGGWLSHGQGSVLNPFNLMKSKATIKQEIKEGDRSGMIRYLSKGGADNEKEGFRKYFDDKKNSAPNHAAKQAFEAKKQSKLKESERRYDFFKQQLAKNAIKSSTKNSATIAQDLRKIKREEDKVWSKYYSQIANAGKLFGAQDKEQHRSLLEKNKDIEREKQEQLKKIAQMKIEVKSVADVVAEIKALEEKSSIAAKAAAKAAGKDPDLVERENKEMATALREKLKETLQREYDEALAAHAKKQKEFLNLSETDAKALEALKGKELQEALKVHLQKEYDKDLLEHVKKQKEFLSLSEKKREALEVLQGKDLQEALKEHLGNSYSQERREQLIVSLNAAALRSFDAKGSNKLKEYGGMDALKDGLSAIDSKTNDATLFEKAARLDFYNSELEKGDGASGVGSSFEQDSAAGASDVAANPGATPDVGQTATSTPAAGVSPQARAQAREQAMQQQVAKLNAVVASKVNAKKSTAAEPDLADEDNALEELKKELNPKDADAERQKYDRSVLKSILTVQRDILSSKIEDCQNRIERETANCEDLKRQHPGDLTHRDIKKSEAVIFGYNKEYTSLTGLRSEISNEIIALDSAS